MPLLKMVPVISKVLVLVAVPMVALSVISYPSLKKLWQQSRTHTAQLGAISSAISDLVYAMAAERGTSAGYLGSRDEDFKTRLDSARTASDQTLARMEEALGQLEYTATTPVSVQGSPRPGTTWIRLQKTGTPWIGGRCRCPRQLNPKPN